MNTRIFVSFTARLLDGQRVFGNAEISNKGKINGIADINELEAALQRQSTDLLPGTIIIQNWREFE